MADMANHPSNTAHDAVTQLANKGDLNIASKPQAHSQVMSLDPSLRMESIHPLIAEVKLSSTITPNAPNHPLTTLNPLTSRPFTIDELRAHKLESLLSQYPTAEAAFNARENTAIELRELLDEHERRNKEIDHEMEEKEKTREIERKVFARRSGKEV